ncbi:MAG: DUF1800 domain-containing protein [candidate division KSB1 bacterium]|nr:DUF1800 domain-containing protein [candidate division KSB1 bacterium]
MKGATQTQNMRYTSAGEWKPRPFPSAANWGRTQAQHLFMRAAFGASHQELKGILDANIPRTQLVDILLKDEPLPPPPGDWINEPYIPRGLTRDQRRELQRKNRERLRDLLLWWMTLMAKTPLNLREKMVLFWHGHFVVEASVVKVAQFLYRYLHMLRKNALGNFRTFLKEMWRDPAMMIYLNGNQNRKQKPNENFARELLELFTMGVDTLYTEEDIKEAARAFTGWQVSGETLSSYFVPGRHDYGVKSFLGRRGNFSGDDIVDIILEQPVTAEFICRKLYRFFVSPEVNEEHVKELAQIFRMNDYEIKPVMREILNADYFYDPGNMGSIIKCPIQLAISLLRQMTPDSVDPLYIYSASKTLGQVMLDPPNVAGWPGQRSWISPITLASRAYFGEAAILGGRIDRSNFNRRQKPIQIDVMAFARSFGTDHPRELLDRWLEHLLPLEPAPVTKDFLLSVLLEGSAENDWSLDYTGVETRVQNCLAEILKLPEYQLM